MWKKTIALFLCLALMLTIVPNTLAVETEEEEQNEALSVEMTVSILDAGKIVVAGEDLTVTDCDEDGKLTINDALILAHENFYEGGAEAGYASAESVYGMSVLKLWGKDHGGFGYCVNHVPAMSLLDAVKDGDNLTAYTYSDLENWSDVYTYFDCDDVQVYANQQFELTLYSLGYDADWNPVKSPLSGAKITVNGNATSFETDADGKVSLFVTKNSVISVVVADETVTIVPPVVKANIMLLGDAAKVISFSDVPSTMWYYEVVMEAASLGLLKGKDTVKRIYDPEANLTVAEFLTILYRFGEKIGQYSGKATTGVKWKEAATFMISELNIYKNWGLDKAITREEMASAITGYILKLTQFTGRSVYTDNSKGKGYTDVANSAYKASILFLQKAGVINGYPDGTFKPNQNISRAEAAQIIYNLNHELSLSA